MSIEQVPFGRTPEGKDVEQFVLSSRSEHVVVKIITFGGRVTELHVPDRQGRSGNIVLGHDRLQPYLDDRAYLGAIVGRVANRIAGGRFTLDGIEYKLPTNNGPNTLHGGTVGFDKALWKATPHDGPDGPSLSLRHVSRDGDQGFPGTLDTTVVYTLDGDALRIDYSATTDHATPVNLSNHAYFNLRGPGSGDVLDHRLVVAASAYTPVNDTLIPTGAIEQTNQTPFSFLKEARIGDRLRQVPGGPPIGYDHNLVLDSAGDVSKTAARVAEPTTGRVMEVFTTEPGVQFYTGNFLDGSIRGIGGVYSQYGAFCLETQHFPDAVNQASFPSTVLRPGETYRQTTIYRFATDRT